MGCPDPWSRNIFDSVFLFWSAFFVQSAWLLYDCAKSHFSSIWHLTLIARLGFYDFLGGYAPMHMNQIQSMILQT
jgi:hypothetical protein